MVSSPRELAIDPRKLAAIYANDLEAIFEHVSDPVIMWNSKGGALYALVLASHAELAKTKMNQIVRRKSAKAVGSAMSTRSIRRAWT